MSQNCRSFNSNSKAISNPEVLKGKTKQRVQEAIEKTGYVVNEAARSLRKNKAGATLSYSGCFKPVFLIGFERSWIEASNPTTTFGCQHRRWFWKGKTIIQLCKVKKPMEYWYSVEDSRHWMSWWKILLLLQWSPWMSGLIRQTYQQSQLMDITAKISQILHGMGHSEWIWADHQIVYRLP